MEGKVPAPAKPPVTKGDLGMPQKGEKAPARPIIFRRDGGDGGKSPLGLPEPFTGRGAGELMGDVRSSDACARLRSPVHTCAHLSR